MVDWGLDLSQFFDAERDFSGWQFVFVKARKSQSESLLQAIHEVALANNVYDDYADFWLQPVEFPEINMAKVFFITCPSALKFFLPYLRPGHYRLPVQDRLFLSPRLLLLAGIDTLRYVLWVDGKVQKEDIQALDAD